MPSGRDVIGLAETGSGKTGAFALPILQSLLASPQRLHTLVLTPTRELAFQISEQFEALGSSIGVKCGTCPLQINWFAVMHMTFCGSVPDTGLISVAAVIVGGIDMMSQSLVLAKKPHIVIGKTTATISFHIHQRSIHALLHVCVSLLVLNQCVCNNPQHSSYPYCTVTPYLI